MVLDCPPPPGVYATQTLTDFPAPVAHSLANHVPNLTAPDAAFSGGDVVMPGKTGLDRRLITAFHRGNRWVIAYEAAGRGYHHVVVAYDVSEDGKTSQIAFKAQSLPANTCATLARGLEENGPVDRFW